MLSNCEFCWRRLLRVPWTARRSNQSVLKEINLEYSLEELMLGWSSSTLATWWEEPTDWKRPWCWERLRAGEGDHRGWDSWMASPTQWILGFEFFISMGHYKNNWSPMCRLPPVHDNFLLTNMWISCFSHRGACSIWSKNSPVRKSRAPVLFLLCPSHLCSLRQVTSSFGPRGWNQISS